MITIDKLLNLIIDNGIDNLHRNLPKKDKRILLSLFTQQKNGQFLTKNQGQLLLSVLLENRKYLTTLSEIEKGYLDNPTWSKEFRVITTVRKIYIDDDKLVVEFTHDPKIKDAIVELSKLINENIFSITAKRYDIYLTERAVFETVNCLSKYNFSLSDDLQEIYDAICEAIKQNKNRFEYPTEYHETINEHLKNDIGTITPLLLRDRSIRYQYNTIEVANLSLTHKIANRTSPSIWIDDTVVPLDTLINSLIELQRLPILCIFNGHQSDTSATNLKLLSTALHNHELDDKVGIYFRYPKNSEFNQLVSDFGFNTYLTSDTNVVGLAHNKLPKFMLQEPWYPKAVISFVPQMYATKNRLYCDGVDLLIFYSDRKPLSGDTIAPV